MMKITHLSTYDVTGGAARAAYRLHKGLCALGQDSTMCVKYKSSADSSVIQFDPPSDYGSRIKQAVSRRLLSASRQPVFSMSPYFSNDRGENTDAILRMTAEADIIHLHWVARFIDSGEFFRRVPSRQPIIWTLHDMNPFTAGCHFDAGCGKYKTRCGPCPQMEGLDLPDHSYQAWQRKHAAYAYLKRHVTHVVAPSRWLASEARNNPLMEGIPVSVIPNGIDTDLFQPRDQLFARKIFSIPSEAKVVLFVADWASEKRKGLEYLLDALAGLRQMENLHLFAVGKGIPADVLGPNATVISNVSDEITLSLIYSSADLFVLPSIQDNLPNTAIEALACGTPIVAFSTGGLPDIVRDGVTGALVPRGDVVKLRQAIQHVLDDDARRLRMAEECRRVALEDYRFEAQAEHYSTLYQEALLQRQPSFSGVSKMAPVTNA